MAASFTSTKISTDECYFIGLPIVFSAETLVYQVVDEGENCENLDPLASPHSGKVFYVPENSKHLPHTRWLTLMDGSAV